MQIQLKYDFLPHHIGEALMRPFQQDEKSLNSKAVFDRKGKKKFWKREVQKGNVRYI